MSVRLSSPALLDEQFTVPVPEGSSWWRSVQRTMARWSDRSDHTARRGAAVAALSPLDPLSMRSQARVAAAEKLGSTTDLTALARSVPVQVLAEALGFADPSQAVHHQQVFSAAVAPEEGAPVAVDAQVDRSLRWLLDATGVDGTEAANRVALLHQCSDATAGLILAGLCRWRCDGLPDGADPVAGLVGWVLEHEPPVEHTVRLDPTGNVVTVALAQAPFGAGAHECPGKTLARALAAGVLDSWCVPGLETRIRVRGFERRANLRVAQVDLGAVGAP